ncbi:MFS transporter [Corynebacterium sp. UMB6689]|uniref:MFS transporter n=2 Tax=Corynebacterium TaxID=1716 RepID=A0A558GIK2_9CORY|nr:MFS transporter [Corynebacterium sp. HMSC072D12]MDK6812703.1 MFS transporter [Corynebacterium sp. UMB6689]OFQ34362.1 MFS transporter permease [Corynebacterium sp. HMSC072D12]TVU56713.1 MFS transporter [Corynebacterium aurimucosum]
MSQTSSESRSLITPTFVFAWLVNFAQFTVFYLLVTIMALYAVEQFQASDTAGGFASSAFVVGATIARLFSGYIVDAAGRKRSLVISLIVVTVAMALYFPAQSLPLLFAVRIVHGFGYAVASTAVMAVAQSVIPDHRRAEGTGYFALGTTLATAFGPAAGLAIVHNAGYNSVFLVALTLTVVALGLGLVVKAPAQEHRSVSFSLGNIVHPAVAPFGVFILLVGVAYTGIITFLNGYSSHAGLEKGASYFFLAYAVVSLVLRFVLGRLQDRRGDNIIIYSSLVFFIAGLAVLASAGADWQIVAAGVLVGIGYGSILPAGQAIAVRLVPMHEMGAGISTFFLLLDLGIGFGPILLGQVISATGYSAMYWMLAALMLVASVVYFIVHGRKDVARGDVRYE